MNHDGWALGRRRPTPAGKDRREAATVIVSPHLDDAVLSCGRYLAATPETTVITVFAGSKKDPSTLTQWDQMCGFQPGQDVMAARRQEDRRALDLLGAISIPLEGLDREYRSGPPDMPKLVAWVTDKLAALRPAEVMVPLGLYHEDHKHASDVAIRATAAAGYKQCVVYGDWYHATKPELIEPRVAEITEQFGPLADITRRQGSRWSKRQAISRYRSQLKGMGDNVHRWGSRIEERYWSLALPPSAELGDL